MVGGRMVKRTFVVGSHLRNCTSSEGWGGTIVHRRGGDIFYNNVRFTPNFNTMIVPVNNDTTKELHLTQHPYKLNTIVAWFNYITRRRMRNVFLMEDSDKSGAVVKRQGKLQYNPRTHQLKCQLLDPYTKDILVFGELHEQSNDGLYVIQCIRNIVMHTNCTVDVYTEWGHSWTSYKEGASQFGGGGVLASAMIIALKDLADNHQNNIRLHFSDIRINGTGWDWGKTNPISSRCGFDIYRLSDQLHNQQYGHELLFKLFFHSTYWPPLEVTKYDNESAIRSVFPTSNDYTDILILKERMTKQLTHFLDDTQYNKADCIRHIYHFIKDYYTHDLHVLNVIPDIFTFLRMFRNFNMDECTNIHWSSHQPVCIYLAHWGHCSNLKDLVLRFFGHTQYNLRGMMYGIDQYDKEYFNIYHNFNPPLYLYYNENASPPCWLISATAGDFDSVFVRLKATETDIFGWSWKEYSKDTNTWTSKPHITTNFIHDVNDRDKGTYSIIISGTGIPQPVTGMLQYMLGNSEVTSMTFKRTTDKLGDHHVFRYEQDGTPSQKYRKAINDFNPTDSCNFRNKKINLNSPNKNIFGIGNLKLDVNVVPDGNPTFRTTARRDTSDQYKTVIQTDVIKTPKSGRGFWW